MTCVKAPCKNSGVSYGMSSSSGATHGAPWRRGVLILISAFVWAALPTARAIELHVAPHGNDAWTGRSAVLQEAGTNGPFATLSRARTELRSMRAAGRLNAVGTTVWVHDGAYELTKPLALTAADSGTAQFPIVFRAVNTGKAVLIGGRQITGFTSHHGQVLKTDVNTQGFAGFHFRQLFFAGRRQHLARHPNFDPQNPYGGGWAYADGKFVNMYQDVPGEDRRTFTLKEADVRHWSQPGEVEVFVFPRYNWWNNIERIQSLDAGSRRVTLARDCSYPIRPGDRYYFRNALEELDAPGEWYLDRTNGTLYFWPPAPLAAGAVYAPTTRTILELGPGTANVTFRGFTIECAEGDAVVLKNTTNCLIAACTIRNVGDYRGTGVGISGGARNGVTGCDIYEIGSHGIHLSGGDRRTLTAAGNYADNNYLHHVGVFYKQGVGISLNGVGNRASHNLIHDGPRMGIMFSGNNLVLEYNHLRHLNLETEDTGAVYTGGRDWISSRGTVIRYNYFHDMLGYGHDDKGRWISPHFAWGVYLDDNTGGVDVIGNIIVRCSRAGLHLHNGRDNFIANNIIVENGQQQFEYSGWTTNHSYWKDHLPSMIKGFESVAQEPAWRAMRNMQLHPTNAPLPDGKIMSGNIFMRNIVAWMNPKAKLARFSSVSFENNLTDSNLYWHAGLPIKTGQKPKAGQPTGTNEWEAWQANGMDRHSLVADPQFENLEKDDFRLKPNSPALRLGFEPIPFEKMGPYADALRASWPIVEAEGAREKPIMSPAK